MSSSTTVHGFKNPQQSTWGRAYWEGAARGQLVLQHCNDCGAITHPPGQLCTSCLSPNSRHEASTGLGEVYSYTLCTRAMHDEFASDVPYLIVYVTLDEGVTIVSWLREADEVGELIGLRVRVVFEKMDDETYLHRFVPAA